MTTEIAEPVRVAVVGLGSAGSLHARSLTEGKVPGAVLVAVVGSVQRLRAVTPVLPSDVRRFETLPELLSEPDVCDATIIATPHLQHSEQTIACLRAGLHVLCEKPAGVRVREARAMTEAACKAKRVYALNYNRRTVPLYQTLRALVQNGEIGTIQRLLWTSTAWLRGQAYYDSSTWRGTWAGEGGGMLLNQWPHLLDLWQWIFGMPVTLHASCAFGKYHQIEVEDEVTVFAQYATGATAVLIGNTGEAPGTERLEIIGNRGRIIAENQQIRITRLKAGTVDEFIAHSPAGFAVPATDEETLTLNDEGDLVSGITKDFVAAIAHNGNTALLAPGADGTKSLMLANAILLSAWQGGKHDSPAAYRCRRDTIRAATVRQNPCLANALCRAVHDFFFRRIVSLTHRR